MSYQHIFFDLDDTLWDLKKNSHEALSELIIKYNLTQLGLNDNEAFIDYFKVVNEELWELYRKSLVDRDALRIGRFQKVLQQFNIEDIGLSGKMSADYSLIAPLKKNLHSYTVEVLNYLNQKYKLHIITNGFEQIQHIKLNTCDIKKYFNQIITADNSGYKKPDERIFKYAMDITGALPQNSLMIGDSIEVDVIGAKNIGMQAVLYNPYELDHEYDSIVQIKNLKDLIRIL